MVSGGPSTLDGYLGSAALQPCISCFTTPPGALQVLAAAVPRVGDEAPSSPTLSLLRARSLSLFLSPPAPLLSLWLYLSVGLPVCLPVCLHIKLPLGRCRYSRIIHFTTLYQSRNNLVSVALQPCISCVTTPPGALQVLAAAVPRIGNEAPGGASCFVR